MNEQRQQLPHHRGHANNNNIGYDFKAMRNGFMLALVMLYMARIVWFLPAEGDVYHQLLREDVAQAKMLRERRYNHAHNNIHNDNNHYAGHGHGNNHRIHSHSSHHHNSHPNHPMHGVAEGDNRNTLYRIPNHNQAMLHGNDNDNDFDGSENLEDEPNTATATNTNPPTTTEGEEADAGTAVKTAPHVGGSTAPPAGGNGEESGEDSGEETEEESGEESGEESEATEEE